MSTVLNRKKLSHTPDYVVLIPPGEVIAEKIGEMKIDVTELARRMDLPTETIKQLLDAEIPLTPELAEKLENATEMPANLMLKFEKRYRKTLNFVEKHPDYLIFR